MKRYVRHLAIGLAVAASTAATLSGYVVYGPKWPDGAIIMHLQLGSSSGLIDGCGSWGCSAEAALGIWNQYVQTSQFQVVRDSTVTKDKCNPSAAPCNTNVFYASDVYGMPFGGSTLAITVRRWFLNNNRVFETDVVFNTAFTWDSYRGKRRTGITDLRRVGIHEFGHALGLGHPDENGQNVSSIMNAFISDIDNLTQDDIDGVRAAYGGNPGRVISFPGRQESRAFRDGLEFTYRDNLHRGQVFSFTDIEGAVVWIQEYLRYRLNGCSHDQATERTRIQILGGGVQPVCGPAAPGPIEFPGREQTRAFRDFLEDLYRNVLGRGAILTYVDLEGDVVWIQEYIRYRLRGCDHNTATQKVLIQLLGGGVQPVCA